MLKGELTSPINPKENCRFAQRCPYAKDICFVSEPEFKEHVKGHKVACHFAGDFR